MKILLMGPPGVGKGTQSKLICDFYNLMHISTGDILRNHINEGTEIGKVIKKFDIHKGKFVPDYLINDLVKQIHDKDVYFDSYLLDGYPRTVDQAKFYVNEILKKDSKYMVIHLSANKDFILDRICNRVTCGKCGNVYNLKTKSPKIHGICDECGNNLVKRQDDDIEIFKKRLEIYNNVTYATINYFRELKVLFEVDASGEVEFIFNKIKNVIGEYYDLY